MNSIAMRANYKGREVWNLPTISFGVVDIRSEPYTSFRLEPSRRPGRSTHEPTSH